MKGKTTFSMSSWKPRRSCAGVLCSCWRSAAYLAARCSISAMLWLCGTAAGSGTAMAPDHALTSSVFQVSAYYSSVPPRPAYYYARFAGVCSGTCQQEARSSTTKTGVTIRSTGYIETARWIRLAKQHHPSSRRTLQDLRQPREQGSRPHTGGGIRIAACQDP